MIGLVSNPLISQINDFYSRMSELRKLHEDLIVKRSSFSQGNPYSPSSDFINYNRFCNNKKLVEFEYQECLKDIRDLKKSLSVFLRDEKEFFNKNLFPKLLLKLDELKFFLNNLSGNLKLTHIDECGESKSIK
jgi:hypothetical protein